MTPRRPVHRAVTLLVGGIAAAALVGCGNGMQVAGPGNPSESVVSGDSSPSAKAPHSASASPRTEPTPSGDDSTGSNDSSDSGDDNGGQQEDPEGSTDGGATAPKDDTPKKSPNKKQGKHGSGTSGHKSGGSTDTSDGDSTAPPSSTGGSKRQKSTTSKPQCALDDLAIAARIPAGSGAAGSRYVLITFTNTTDASCWMYGYAGVSFVGNKDGTQLGKPAHRDRSAKPKRVKLSAGEVQTALLRIADAGNWDASECAPTTSDGFRIYPPGSYTSAYVKFATEVCQSKSVRQMTVYPVGIKS